MHNLLAEWIRARDKFADVFDGYLVSATVRSRNTDGLLKLLVSLLQYRNVVVQSSQFVFAFFNNVLHFISIAVHLYFEVYHAANGGLGLRDDIRTDHIYLVKKLLLLNTSVLTCSLVLIVLILIRRKLGTSFGNSSCSSCSCNSSSLYFVEQVGSSRASSNRLLSSHILWLCCLRLKHIGGDLLVAKAHSLVNLR